MFKVAQELVDYAKSKNWHQELGRVQLGYDTSQEVYWTEKYTKRYDQTRNLSVFFHYQFSREEMIADMMAAQKTGDQVMVNALKKAYLYIFVVQKALHPQANIKSKPIVQ